SFSLPTHGSGGVSIISPISFVGSRQPEPSGESDLMYWMMSERLSSETAHLYIGVPSSPCRTSAARAVSLGRYLGSTLVNLKVLCLKLRGGGRSERAERPLPSPSSPWQLLQYWTKSCRPRVSRAALTTCQ